MSFIFIAKFDTFSQQRIIQVFLIEFFKIYFLEKKDQSSHWKSMNKLIMITYSDKKKKKKIAYHLRCTNAPD